MPEYIIDTAQMEIDRKHPVVRCGDCRFGDTYAPDRGFRDCRMMRHKIVPIDCYCGLGKPKEVEE